METQLITIASQSRNSQKIEIIFLQWKENIKVIKHQQNKIINKHKQEYTKKINRLKSMSKILILVTVNRRNKTKQHTKEE